MPCSRTRASSFPLRRSLSPVPLASQAVELNLSCPNVARGGLDLLSFTPFVTFSLFFVALAYWLDWFDPHAATGTDARAVSA